MGQTAVPERRAVWNAQPVADDVEVGEDGERGRGESHAAVEAHAEPAADSRRGPAQHRVGHDGGHRRPGGRLLPQLCNRGLSFGLGTHLKNRLKEKTLVQITQNNMLD